MPRADGKPFSGIFVSYHRDDSAGYAGRLFDRLSAHFGETQVFMDVERMQVGEDIVETIEDAIGSSEILIAIIGRRWLLNAEDHSHRLDNPNDFVRLEITTAFNRELRVVPVLVQGAVMPQTPDLPNDLAKLSRLNAIELSDLRWQRDADQLISALERILVQREEERRRAAEEAEERQRRGAETLEIEQALRLAEAPRQVSEKREPNSYPTKLYRDPNRSEIELQIGEPKRRLEVYWTPDGATQLRTLPDGANASELVKGADTIFLEPRTIRFDARSGFPRELLNFKIGNSGIVGTGVVQVNIETSIRCDPVVRNSIQMDGSHTLDELLDVYDFKVQQRKVAIKEGEPAQSRQVHFHPGIISRIIPGRIPADRIAAEIYLNIRVEDDQKGVTWRTLTLIIPFSLEQLPGSNWLAIDFGNSAISAALGTGQDGTAILIPLQEITVEGGHSFARFDPETSERDNRYLLPSSVCCNADLRTEAGDKRRPGFPGYYSDNLSMTPGEADFIGLPAVTHEFEDHPGRIIYSLKSWLSNASRNIPIQINENGQEVQKFLPTEKIVESTFAALLEAYLFDPAYRADQIVITHPNSLTPRHRDLLHRIAYRALGKPNRLAIPLPERVRLISESDAVAFYYCSEQMRGQPRAGTERILVYDFGAGTLDLSLITVVWKQDPPRYPINWKIEKRLGVPVAGNYIDEILARIIHSFLSNRSLVDAKGFNYRLPIVGKHLDKLDPLHHRRAIIRLWNGIREAKHQWSGACRKVLNDGRRLTDYPPLNVKVGSLADLDVVVPISWCDVLNVEKPTDEPGLWVAENRGIYLSIPASLIDSDQRMSSFLDFVTVEVITEVLASAGIAAADIDTVIVSGRGALYSGLRERVWGYFPNAKTPDLLLNGTMKSAVVLGGAIARQALSRVFEDASDNVALASQLGVLLNYGNDLVLEKDWNKPIDLTASPTFRLVQVNLNAPNSREDMKSLRKHFYIDLTDHDFNRDSILGDDKLLYVHKEIRDGELVIYLEDKEGENRISVFAEAQISKTVTTPAWPVGNVLLEPQE